MCKGFGCGSCVARAARRVSVTVRLFAAAAEAAGTEQTVLTGATVGELELALDARFGTEFAHVRRQCSVMVDGVRSAAGVKVPHGATIDVLPPFAGG